MGYLFSQSFIWLLLAFLFGLFSGWLLRGLMCREETSSAVTSQKKATGASVDGTQAAADTNVREQAASDTEVESAGSAGSAGSPTNIAHIRDDMRPASLAAPNGIADDLKRIKGVGPVLQDTLNELGIYHFQQIADLSDDNVAWVDNYIAFPGRIEREGWVNQAADLVKGVKTEFSERYDRGEVGEDNPNRED